jgi:hypothetical protein
VEDHHCCYHCRYFLPSNVVVDNAMVVVVPAKKYHPLLILPYCDSFAMVDRTD